MDATIYLTGEWYDGPPMAEVEHDLAAAAAIDAYLRTTKTATPELVIAAALEMRWLSDQIASYQHIPY
jgi:hypothetical protein